jgi:hypothetical protein
MLTRSSGRRAGQRAPAGSRDALMLTAGARRNKIFSVRLAGLALAEPGVLARR